MGGAGSGVGRFHHGWLVALVLFLALGLTIGITQYSFGVFVTELESDLGWSRSGLNGALTLFAVGGLLAPVVGRLIDSRGARPVMMVSFALLAVSHLLRPLVAELWQFYALSLVQYAAMPGTVMLPVGKLIGLWFPATRGRALGIAAMGANFGGATFSTLSAVLITEVGWREAYAVYGVLFALMIPLVWLVIREDGPGAVSGSGHGAGEGMSSRGALQSRSFYLVVVSLTLAQLTYLSVMTQVVPHLENVGFDRTRAAAALSAMAVCGMGGKFLLGWMTERVPSRFVLILSLALQVAGLAILLAAGGGGAVWLFVPVFGVGFGALGALMPLLVQETFGLREFGAIFGLVNFFTQGASIVGPPLVGLSFDVTGAYTVAFTTIAMLFVVAAVFAAFAAPPGEERAAREGAAAN